MINLIVAGFYDNLMETKDNEVLRKTIKEKLHFTIIKPEIQVVEYVFVLF